jgi:hypothetical protein
MTEQRGAGNRLPVFSPKGHLTERAKIGQLTEETKNGHLTEKV